MWIEVFRSGKHTDSQGKAQEYSDEDIVRIADNYNSSIAEDSSNEVPIVKGHPKTDDPAYGWVERLKVNGSKLLAKVKDIVPEFAEEVKAGRYKKISIALYPGNMLRHIGFLGAVAPAVKGLKSVAFSQKSEFVEYSYLPISTVNGGEISKLKKENNRLRLKLKDMENERQKAEYNEFVEGLVVENKITPHQAKTLSSILTKVSAHNEYSEGESLTNMIMEFAGSMTNMTGLRTEFAENEIPDDDGQYSEKNTAPERLALHNKAKIISSNNPNIPYEQALLLALDQ